MRMLQTTLHSSAARTLSVTLGVTRNLAMPPQPDKMRKVARVSRRQKRNKVIFFNEQLKHQLWD